MGGAVSAGWYTDAVRARAKSPAGDSDGFRARLRTACTVFPGTVPSGGAARLKAVAAAFSSPGLGPAMPFGPLNWARA